MSHAASHTSSACFAIQPYGTGPTLANSGRKRVPTMPTITVNTASTNVLTSTNPWATTIFDKYTEGRGTGSAKMCFHCLSECSMPLSSAVSSVISSGIMKTAQICSEFVACVCHRLKSEGNFSVRQITKNCSNATNNGITKITRNARVRFSFNNSACNARNNDINRSSVQLAHPSTSEKCPRANAARLPDEKRPDDGPTIAG